MVSRADLAPEVIEPPFTAATPPTICRPSTSHAQHHLSKPAALEPGGHHGAGKPRFATAIESKVNGNRNNGNFCKVERACIFVIWRDHDYILYSSGVGLFIHTIRGG